MIRNFLKDRKKGLKRLSRIIGTFFILIGFFLFSRNVFFLATGLQATGTVVNIIRTEGPASGSGVTYYYVIVFRDNRGATHEFQSSLGRSIPTLKEGDPIRVLYSPSDPKKAMECGFINMWFIPLAFLAGGAAAIIFQDMPGHLCMPGQLTARGRKTQQNEN